MAQISLRVEDAVKREAETTFEEIGLSMTTAINIFLKAVQGKNAFPLSFLRIRSIPPATWPICAGVLPP